jgi:hypothetical protein
MTNQHWVTYIVPVMIAIIIAIAGIGFYMLAGYTSGHEMWISHGSLIAGLLCVLLAHHWIFHRILSKIADVIIVTNERVIDMQVRLLFNEAIFEVQLSKVQSVTAAKRNIIAALLNYGDIEFKPSGKLQYIPYPQRIAREIEKAMGMA